MFNRIKAKGNHNIMVNCSNLLKSKGYKIYSVELNGIYESGNTDSISIWLATRDDQDREICVDMIKTFITTGNTFYDICKGLKNAGIILKWVSPFETIYLFNVYETITTERLELINGAKAKFTVESKLMNGNPCHLEYFMEKGAE